MMDRLKVSLLRGGSETGDNIDSVLDVILSLEEKVKLTHHALVSVMIHRRGPGVAGQVEILNHWSSGRVAVGHPGIIEHLADISTLSDNRASWGGEKLETKGVVEKTQISHLVGRVVLSDVLGSKDVVEGRDGRTDGRTRRIVIGRIRVKTELHA
jgi:hypothetical protein